MKRNLAVPEHIASQEATPPKTDEPLKAWPEGEAFIEGIDAAEFIECAYNEGEPIDWSDWVGNRPVLNAAQAVRLMAGLEPDLHKSLAIGRKESAGDAKLRARKFEEWARAQAQPMERASPAEWLAWADGKGRPVHVGFRLAVEQYAGNAIAPAVEAATIAGPSKMGNSTKGKRVQQLTAEIEAAKLEATNPDDAHAVYAVLQRWAERGTSPFIGFVDGEGIKYRTPTGEVKFLTFDALHKRMKRAANAR